MAELTTIARPYAEAVFKLAREESHIGEWTEALALLDLVISDPGMLAGIRDPNVSAQQLESIVLSVVGVQLDGACRNFVQVLIQNGRLEIVPQIRTLYEELRRQHEGILEARIISALPIDDGQVARLVARLESKYRRKVSAKVEIDPQLIGGVKILVGDKVIDATVRGRLEAMAAALTH
ncbi:MAG: F0F1 ATP synthase subunit delta [Betaproteobacteria bacterium]|nr:F0F1 ATP synthase subunit delta [Betaproteobacteria bacterium]